MKKRYSILNRIAKAKEENLYVAEDKIAGK